MKILMAAAEMDPFARSGAFADFMRDLPAALRREGHEVGVVVPCYRSAREVGGRKLRKTGVSFPVQVGDASLPCEILETRTEQDVQVFFVRRDEFFDRSGLYGSDGRDYQDNAARYIFFAKAVLELARRADPTPDIIHGHDWPCGLIPVLSRHAGLPFRHVYSIHDLHFQGNFWSYDFALTNLPGSYFGPGGVEFYGSLNFLKSGILFADRVVLPGELVLSEAMTPGHGCGLETLLREQAAKVVGIPYGIDPEVWNPSTDASIPAKFSATKLKGKKDCRAALLKKWQLDPEASGPVVAYLSRLVDSQGIGLVVEALDRLMEEDIRLIVAGRGDGKMDTALLTAARKHQGRMAFLREPTSEEIHGIVAGADALLAPAGLETAGLRVRQALRYGTVPVVRASGGLRQIVEDFDPAENSGNGFVFYVSTAEAVIDSVRRATRLFADTKLWTRMVKAGLGSDFSWGISARRHAALYESLRTTNGGG